MSLLKKETFTREDGGIYQSFTGDENPVLDTINVIVFWTLFVPIVFISIIKLFTCTLSG